MNKLLAILVTATIYHADPAQCNADYLTTASLKTINKSNPQGHRWIAVSRDLEKYGFTFGTRVCIEGAGSYDGYWTCLLYTSPSPRDRQKSRMPSSA